MSKKQEDFEETGNRKGSCTSTQDYHMSNPVRQTSHQGMESEIKETHILRL